MFGDPRTGAPAVGRGLPWAAGDRMVSGAEGVIRWGRPFWLHSSRRRGT